MLQNQVFEERQKHIYWYYMYLWNGFVLREEPEDSPERT
ncbi:MAG: hypothetical protein BAJATHORv1_100075 [Candidatus Thorarchaeota archaeon]|nr:MAG: hypothetical protein BAJATHORv1_100075 [Candidatus Thorarchaeota archaeon]